MKQFKIWVRVEVRDTDTDEHEDLDPEFCEYKLAMFNDLADVAEFIARVGQEFNDEESVYTELREQMIEQFGDYR